MSGGRGPGRRGTPPPEGAWLCCFLAVWLWQAVGFFFFSFLLKKFLFISFLFLALLDLRFCSQAFSGCSERGPLSYCVVRASHCNGLSCCGATTHPLRWQAGVSLDFLSLCFLF